jgi:hypothetical protein
MILMFFVKEFQIQTVFQVRMEFARQMVVLFVEKVMEVLDALQLLAIVIAW